MTDGLKTHWKLELAEKVPTTLLEISRKAPVFRFLRVPELLPGPVPASVH